MCESWRCGYKSSPVFECKHGLYAVHGNDKALLEMMDTSLSVDSCFTSIGGLVLVEGMDKAAQPRGAVGNES